MNTDFTLIWLISLMVYQLFMDYLKPKFDLFLNDWLQS